MLKVVPLEPGPLIPYCHAMSFHEIGNGFELALTAGGTKSTGTKKGAWLIFFIVHDELRPRPA